MKIRLGALGATALMALPMIASAEPMGRVVAVRGDVSATTPDGDTRKLHCNDPVFPGDRIVSAESGGVGILSGDAYAGLDEKSTLEVGFTDVGTPLLDLRDGHLRLVDAEGDTRTRIETPGLLAYHAGTDTEAFAFGEKLGAVSMICPWDDGVEVSSVAPGRAGTRANPGFCAIDKPREPIFTTEATHAKLGVINDHCLPVAGTAAPRFGDPADVALGPPLSALAAGPALVGAFGDDVRTSCDVAGACTRPTQIRTNPFPNVRP